MPSRGLVMDIVVLPPEAEPKQLTAKVVLHRLGDHLQAFLAHNNMHGYLKDPEYVLRDDRVADILLDVASRESVHYKTLKEIARKLKLLSDKSMKHGHCLELLARALGYKTWRDCVFSMPESEVIVNMWLDSSSTQIRLFDTTVMNKAEARQVYDIPQIKNMIKANRQRNLK